MGYNREEALELLKKYNKTESLIKHGMAVEAVMRRFARHFGEDEARWGVLGLIHDLDYELYPEEHCKHTGNMMKEAGYSDEDIDVVLSHGYGLCTDIEPTQNISKTLYTIDELTGLVTASALMRPSRSVMDLEVKSLKKKWKDKAFAAGCNRGVIQNGADMLGMSLEDVMALALEGMREAHEALGL